MSFKPLKLLTLDEARRQSAEYRLEPFASESRNEVYCRPHPPPSIACLPSRTREYVLPPRLLPGPTSIRICR